jgi:hypothetical protein
MFISIGDAAFKFIREENDLTIVESMWKNMDRILTVMGIKSNFNCSNKRPYRIFYRQIGSSLAPSERPSLQI